MADLEFLAKLRAAGVKSATFSPDGSEHLAAVEFFPTIAPVDFDTIVPPAPVATEKEAERSASTIPSAFERILTKGSVS